ncbi:uncharacterized protein [Struthio camelus]|uniref:uncharacterized protein isoform X2 n=1 Tax=Struthio camelus TaxID=8801 RepID=UPI0036040034
MHVCADINVIHVVSMWRVRYQEQGLSCSWAPSRLCCRHLGHGICSLIEGYSPISGSCFAMDCPASLQGSFPTVVGRRAQQEVVQSHSCKESFWVGGGIGQGQYANWAAMWEELGNVVLPARPCPGDTGSLSCSSSAPGCVLSSHGRCDRELSSGASTGLQLDVAEASDSEGEEESWLLGDLPTPVLQRLKEDVLGTKAGMDTFQEFLHGTLGLRLLHLWLDCEDFKECTRCLEANATNQEAQLFRTDLLRHIQEKYALNLFPSSLPYETQGRAPETFAILSRTQYDALRRLRSYWVPRFLIHRWRAACLRLAPKPGQKPKTSLPATFLPSLQVFELLPPVGDQHGDTVDRSTGWFCVRRSAGSGRGSGEPCWQPSIPWHIPKTPWTSRILRALQCDLRDGGGFLYYLTRYADAQTVQSLLLWQALEQHWLAWEQQADETQWHHAAWHIFHTYLAPGAPRNAGLSSDMLPYIQQLQDMLSCCRGPRGPMLFEPVAQRVFTILHVAWLCYCHYEITTFRECCVPVSHTEAQATKSKAHEAKKARRHKLRKSKGNTEFHAQEGQEQQRRKKMQSKLESSPSTAVPRGGEEPVPWQQAAALLTNQVVFRVYRKAVEEIQLSCVQRVLDLLQTLQLCLSASEDGKRLSHTRTLLDLWKQQGMGPDSPQLPVELKKRLKAEMTRGAVSNSSLEEIQGALFSHVAPAFEQFWAEVNKGLSRHGVKPSQIQGDGWSSLEPLLHTLASKAAVKHLTKREAKVTSVATAQPNLDDKATLSRSLQAAAKGWPTLEMLHFLNHLQVHGPAMLENGLRFQLEVQKFKNAHRSGPNRAFLRRKVRVIRDCFLLSQLEPKLQLAVDTEKLERAVQTIERALLKDVPLPPPGLFDELCDSVLSSLLPYWAAFRKAWLQRSPESAHRPPGRIVVRTPLFCFRSPITLARWRAYCEGCGRPILRYSCHVTDTFWFPQSAWNWLQDPSAFPPCLCLGKVRANRELISPCRAGSVTLKSGEHTQNGCFSRGTQEGERIAGVFVTGKGKQEARPALLTHCTSLLPQC